MSSRHLWVGSRSSGVAERRRLTGLAFLFGVVALLAGVDLVSDAGEGVSLVHGAIEGTLVFVGLLGLGAMARALSRLRSDAKRLSAETVRLADALDARTQEAERWREEAQASLRGLGEAIDRQLTRWELTTAEKEVALLLLKGLSHKEVSAVRGTSEATTRQQARAAYRKAGLSGRADLSAFFLEDLLLPPE